MVPDEILYRCGSFDWIPLLGIWGAIGYKKRVNEISTAWNQTRHMKRVDVSPMTTLEYSGWRNKRVNDNIPKPSLEGARSMDEYLRVVLSELEIIKQDFKKKSLELEKRIEELEEENNAYEIRRGCSETGGQLKKRRGNLRKIKIVRR
ncbi:hypothetical protein J1N35_037884 [Gossypium stocksii]|uniref:Uncharacterized protein n=1 Tax=Gossypium stocksii TaxID=47602 RepID=A0A9D3ULE1_9ROSI|nr:hypothetical protein J1N35_037884 [Gossypium stocksii]